jgi:endoglucanase
LTTFDDVRRNQAKKSVIGRKRESAPSVRIQLHVDFRLPYLRFDLRFRVWKSVFLASIRLREVNVRRFSAGQRRHPLRALIFASLSLTLMVGIGITTNAPNATAARETVSGSPTFVMRRAVNVSPGTMYVNYRGSDIGDPFYNTTGREDLPQDYPLIKSMGFDTVRFQVEPTPFTVLIGARLDQLEAFIVAKMQPMLDAGLKVVLDLHPFDPEKLGFNASGDTSTTQFSAYIRALERLAGVANRYDPRVVALELMNEPHWNGCEKDSGWSSYQPVIARAARAVAPRTTFILTTGCWGGRNQLSKLDPSTINDPNSYYSVHMYEQVMFTHQGYWKDGSYIKHVDGFPYPSSAADYDGIVARTQARIDADPGLKNAATKLQWKNQAATEIRWFTKDSQLNRAHMSQYVDEIAAWATANGINSNRIFIGEFGVIHRTNDDPPGTAYPDAISRTNWIRDVRELIEQKGFTWAVFNYAGRFGIVENLSMAPNEPRVLLPAMRDALGINDIGNPPPPTTPPPLPTVPPPSTTVTAPTTVPAPTTVLNPSTTTVIIRSSCNKDLVLDVRKLSMVPGGVLQVYWPNRTTNQQFKLMSQGGGNRYRVVASHSGLAIGADADSEGQPVVQKATTAPSADNWEIVSVDNGFVEIRRADSGLYLDVQGASKTPGAPLQLWSYNGSCAQRFRLEPVALN